MFKSILYKLYKLLHYVVIVENYYTHYYYKLLHYVEILQTTTLCKT